MPCELIHDGYTARGTAHGLHFTYRPFTPEEVLYLIEWSDRLEPKAYTEKAAEAIADHLVEWDVTDRGKAAEITPENVGKLPAAVYTKLRDTMIAYKGEDAAKNSAKA